MIHTIVCVIFVHFLRAKTTDSVVIDPVTCPFAMLTGSVVIESVDSDCWRIARSHSLIIQ